MYQPSRHYREYEGSTTGYHEEEDYVDDNYEDYNPAEYAEGDAHGYQPCDDESGMPPPPPLACITEIMSIIMNIIMMKKTKKTNISTCY